MLKRVRFMLLGVQVSWTVMALSSDWALVPAFLFSLWAIRENLRIESKMNRIRTQ